MVSAKRGFIQLITNGCTWFEYFGERSRHCAGDMPSSPQCMWAGAGKVYGVGGGAGKTLRGKGGFWPL